MNINNTNLQIRNCTLMNLEMDDNYHIWKIKLQLAQQGNSQALQDIKSHCFNGSKDFSFIENNLHDALKNSQMKYIQQKQNYGGHQIYSQVPIFLLLEGQIEIKCINLEGDQQVVQKIENKGPIYISKQKISSKFGQSNVNIVTKFHLTALKNSTLIEIKEQSRRKIQNGQKSTSSLVGLREQCIMKKYMIFPLKYIRIENYDPQNKCEEKFYILEGNACYYYQKGKQRHLLAVYQEGYINPKQFSDPDIKFHVFQNTKILIFQEEFMRDDVVAGLQSKRKQHINALVKAYAKISSEQKKKIQIKLINNYKLSKKQVDKQIFGMVQKPIQEKQSSAKKISTKNELISTSSSMKEKCRIRISKKKKVI